MQKQPTIPVKDSYKIKNWKGYSHSLIQRGRIDIWLEESVLRAWRDIDESKIVVGECLYADCVIQCCLLLGVVYHQPLRQTTGFVASLLRLLGHGDFAIPDYSTLCRRQRSLPVEVSKALAGNKKLDIAIDSTGLKVYGEGEWKVRKHGASKRRSWRKLHIGIDVHTQEVVCAELTSNAEDDAATASRMLKDKTAKLKSVRGDGGYDKFDFRETLGDGVKQIIPPPSNAVVHKGTKKKPVPPYLKQRNEAVEFMQAHERKEWKIKEEYHRRSLNEVAIFRYKTSFTDKMSARNLETQKTEVALKCKILNCFRQQGMPVAYKVV